MYNNNANNIRQYLSQNVETVLHLTICVASDNECFILLHQITSVALDNVLHPTMSVTMLCLTIM